MSSSHNGRPLVPLLLVVLVSACQDPSGPTTGVSELTELKGEYHGSITVYVQDTTTMCNLIFGCSYLTLTTTSCEVVTHILHREGLTLTGVADVDPAAGTPVGHPTVCNSGFEGAPMFTPHPFNITAEVAPFGPGRPEGNRTTSVTFRPGGPPSQAALESFLGCFVIGPYDASSWRGNWTILESGGARFFVTLGSTEAAESPRFRCGGRPVRLEMRWGGERVQ